MKKDELERLADVPHKRYNVLYAPTWRNKFNDIDWASIAQLCNRLDCNFIIRPHINDTRDDIVHGWETSIPKHSNLIVRDAKQYPCAEDVLALADVLVTDWSSIAFDYMALKRPIVYVANGSDKMGHLKEDMKGGPLVNVKELDKAIEDVLKSHKKYDKERSVVFKRIHGNNFDGKVTERCVNAIEEVL